MDRWQTVLVEVFIELSIAVCFLVIFGFLRLR